MTLFLTLATGLTLVAAVFILWPLLRKSPSITGESRARRELNRQIYTERLAQIEHEEQGGRLPAELAQQLRDEAGQRLVGDVAQLQDDTDDSAVSGRRRWPAVLLVILAVPLISAVMYLQTDTWMLIGATQDKPAWGYLTGQIEKRLKESPEDVQSQLMLARTKRAQGDTSGAIQAYMRLNQMTDFSVAEYLADEAETRILAAQGAFSDKARLRLEQALAANPDDGRALWYSGLVARAEGDNEKTREYWLRLTDQKLPDNFRKVLNQQLTQMGVAADKLKQPGTAGDGPQVRLDIQARPELVNNLAPDTPVFVMARPADGSRAMLAVRKHQLSELPLQTILTDGMNMAGGPQLSDHEEYLIVVRIAVSGDALPQSGDPFAQIQVSRAEAEQGISLNLDKRWP